MSLELVLDERTAKSKAALTDGAMEGQRGGGTELEMFGKVGPACYKGTAIAREIVLTALGCKNM